MSTDTTDAATDVAEAKEEAKEEKKTRKRGKRTYYRWGRPKLPLADYDTPENGHPPETTCDDWNCFKHKELHNDDFQDPLDYYRWIKEVVVPQLVAVADKKVAELEGIGSASTRANILAVGGSIEETEEIILSKATGPDSTPEAKQAVLRQLAEMMAKVKGSLEG